MPKSTINEQNNAPFFGPRLAAERKRLGLSQKDAAERCGVRREMWGRYERGIAEPGVTVLEHFCALGADPGVLLGGAAKKEPDSDAMAAFAIIDELCAQLGIYKYEQEIWGIGAQLLEDRRADEVHASWAATPPRHRNPMPPTRPETRGWVLMRALLQKSPFVIYDETKGRLQEVIEEFELELQHSGKKISPREKARAIVDIWTKAEDQGRLFSGVFYEVKKFISELP